MPKVRINATAELIYSREVEISEEQFEEYQNLSDLDDNEQELLLETLADYVVMDEHVSDCSIDHDSVSVNLAKPGAAA